MDTYYNSPEAQMEAEQNAYIDWALVQADKYGLQVEVVWSAFKHKEQFPSASLKECFQVGLDEWDI
jgi:peptide subunit release factor 1 (eRF1)